MIENHTTLNTLKDSMSGGFGNLKKLAKYLETSTDYLLGLTDDDTPIKYMNRNLTNKEKELLERFIYLATEDQLKLIGYADSLNNKVTN